MYMFYMDSTQNFFKGWLFVDAPYPGGGERC
jgi:hypothetical protein